MKNLDACLITLTNRIESARVALDEIDGTLKSTGTSPETLQTAIDNYTVAGQLMLTANWKSFGAKKSELLQLDGWKNQDQIIDEIEEMRGIVKDYRDLAQQEQDTKQEKYEQGRLDAVTEILNAIKLRTL